MFFNNLIFILILIVYFYIQNKFFLYAANKSQITVLSDDNFNKLQAFHEKPTFRLGGITFFSSLHLEIILSIWFFVRVNEK